MLLEIVVGWDLPDVVDKAPVAAPHVLQIGRPALQSDPFRDGKNKAAASKVKKPVDYHWQLQITKKIIHWVVATELKMTEWKTVYREYKYSTARLAQV